MPEATSLERDYTELSIVMPCLNEAETLETCIDKAQRVLNDLEIEGEIIVADNIYDARSEGIATAMEEMMMHAGLFEPLASEPSW